jgi:dihydrofolate reductase
MRLGLIYAHARNGVMGKDNALPWRLPEDLAHFKKTTLGCPVVMGRKTWDSVPPRFRPLPGRRNIVITRDANWQEPGAEVARSLDEAVALCAPADMAWITGGAEIFRLAMPRADVAVITEIEADFEGDVIAPALSPGWREVARERHVSANGMAFSFVTYHNDHREI